MKINDTLLWPKSQPITKKRKTKAGLLRSWYEATGELIAICRKRDYNILYINRDSSQPWTVGVSVEYRTKSGQAKLIACDRYRRRSSNLLAIAQYLEYEYKALKIGAAVYDYQPKNLTTL